MRVVGGALRGRRLEAPAGRRTRPTADRVREALFSILGPLEGLSALDLFAGSGALGIEALSRGAAAALFVDDDRRAVAAVRANLTRLGLDARVIRRDALAFLSAPVGAPFGLVFLDPPYSSPPHMAERLAQRLPAVVTPDARIVSESDKRAPLALSLPIVDERIYGDTRLAVHRAE